MTALVIVLGYATVAVVLVWLWRGRFAGAADDRERALIAILPVRARARALARQLRVANARVDEIGRVLARPDFGADALRETAAGLRRRRDREAAELAAIDALIARIGAHVEVARVTGVAEVGTAGLVGELVARVEALADAWPGDVEREARDQGHHPGAAGGGVRVREPWE